MQSINLWQLYQVIRRKRVSIIKSAGRKVNKTGKSGERIDVERMKSFLRGEFS